MKQTTHGKRMIRAAPKAALVFVPLKVGLDCLAAFA